MNIDRSFRGEKMQKGVLRLLLPPSGHWGTRALYGYVYQGISGCLLGGMLMGILPIDLNFILEDNVSENILRHDVSER